MGTKQGLSPKLLPMFECIRVNLGLKVRVKIIPCIKQTHDILVPYRGSRSTTCATGGETTSYLLFY